MQNRDASCAVMHGLATKAISVFWGPETPNRAPFFGISTSKPFSKMFVIDGWTDGYTGLRRHEKAPLNIFQHIISFLFVF